MLPQTEKNKLHHFRLQHSKICMDWNLTLISWLFQQMGLLYVGGTDSLPYACFAWFKAHILKSLACLLIMLCCQNNISIKLLIKGILDWERRHAPQAQNRTTNPCQGRQKELGNGPWSTRSSQLSGPGREAGFWLANFCNGDRREELIF